MSYQLPVGSSSHQHQAPGFLQGGQLIQGGSFIQHNQIHNENASPVHICSKETDGFQHLQSHVAPSAFDSNTNVDAPKCHPNTRTVVINQIIDWVIRAVVGIQCIMWMNGAAGAGKSAIARSVIELCLQRNIPVARFFFFRTDPTRNTTRSLVATLAHQLIKCLPDLRIAITSRIQNDPLIFSQSLQTQFNQLIFEPLLQLQEESASQPTVLLLFDGLDELSGQDNQTELIKILATFIASKSFPLLVFFGSRSEYQIRQAFSLRLVTPLLVQVPLDNNYGADDDIRLFLNDSFTEINESHPFRRLLPEGWPAPEIVEKLVTKSSGQFIYASVVVKFISMPKMHPAQQLDIIHGLRPVGALTPFAQLDALYMHIFSQVENLPDVMYILAAVILLDEQEISFLSYAFPHHISETSAPILLASLSAVLSAEYREVKFLHTSLSDFLLDHTRSQHFYIDKVSWCTRMSTEFSNDGITGATRGIFICYEFLQHAQPTEKLRELLATKWYFRGMETMSAKQSSNYLLAVKNLDFGDGGKVYRLQLKHLVQQLIKTGEKVILEGLERDHDIAQIMQEIRDDEAEREREMFVLRTMTEEETGDEKMVAAVQENTDTDFGDKRSAQTMPETSDEQAADRERVESVAQEMTEEETGDAVQKKRSWGARIIGRPMTRLRKHLKK